MLAAHYFSTAAKRSGEIFGGWLVTGVIAIASTTRPRTRSLGSDDSTRDAVDHL
jgi:hypothetical protein